MSDSDGNSSRFGSIEVIHTGAGNKAFIDMKNLRKQIP